MSLIAVIDDERTNRAILERLLGREHEVVLYETGSDALAVLSEQIPEIVLLDVMMPGPDGYEVCRQIKAQSWGADLPIIFISARDDPASVLAGYEAGGHDYVTKPFNHDEIKEKVRINLRQAAERREFQAGFREASQLVMNSFRENSMLGVVMRLLQRSFHIHDVAELGQAVLETLAELELNATLAMTLQPDTHYHCHGGPATPIERQLLRIMAERGRIVDFHRTRTIFNGTRSALLVKNMPVEDEVRYGQLKDLLAILIDGVDARLSNLDEHRRLLLARENSSTLADEMGQFLATLNQAQERLKVEIGRATDDVAEQMALLLVELGATTELHLEHEQRLEAAVAEHQQRVERLLAGASNLSLAFDRFLERMRSGTLTEEELAQLLQGLR